LEKQYLLYILNVCVCSCLTFRHANRIFSASYYVILCVLSACTTCFSTLSRKRLDFRGGKIIEHKMRVLTSLQLSSEIFLILRRIHTDIIMSSRSQWPRGLWPLACWDCGFESHPGHGYLSVVSVVCCQVEVSATDYHSFRGVLPNVARRCMWSRNLASEEAKAH